MASTAKTDPEEHKREDEENAPAADDEDTGAQVAPIVKLEEVAVSTGEEDEDPILDLCAISISLLFSELLFPYIYFFWVIGYKNDFDTGRRSFIGSIRKGISGRREELVV